MRRILRSSVIPPLPGRPNYGGKMDDPEVAAASAAGELDGLAAALDKYAASLYEYCYSMAPAVAADAVQDTFIIAWSRLGGLRDPGKLHPWLQAVAGNECFRRTLADNVTDAHADVAPEATPPPETTLPPGLPGQILSACADNTPAGRAHRTTVTHRAGRRRYTGIPQHNPAASRWAVRVRRFPEGERPARHMTAPFHAASTGGSCRRGGSGAGGG